MGIRRHAIGLPISGSCVFLLSAAFFAMVKPDMAGAQDVTPLRTVQQVVITLESAVHDAVGWHPSIDQAVAALSSSGQEIEEAKAGYYPQISGGVGPSLSVVGGVSWRPRATVSSSQMLYDFGKVRSSVDAAKAGEKISRADLLQAVDGLARNTSFAVIEVQRGKALLAVAQEQLESLNEINKLVQLRVQRGASTRSDGSQANARIQSAQATILQITAELQRWQSNVRYLTGREGPIEVTRDVPDWLNRACLIIDPIWEEIPVVMQSLGQRDAAEAAYRGARASRFPTISLGADADTDLRDPFAQRNDASVGITISSDLYQGGARKAREQGAFHALQSADAALANARLETTRSLAENREQISSLRKRIDTLGQRRVNMEETGMLYRLQYFDLGTRTLLDLLNAQQELHQTRFDEVNAEHDMRRLNTECLYSSGSLRDAYDLTGMVVQGVTL